MTIDSAGVGRYPALGSSATLKQTLTPGIHRAISLPTRVAIRTETVTILARNRFEPNLVRVRRSNGSVISVDPMDLSFS